MPLLSSLCPICTSPPSPLMSHGNKGMKALGSVLALDGSLKHGLWLWGETHAGCFLALGTLVVFLLYLFSWLGRELLRGWKPSSSEESV